ncbi:MAG: FKBP-type peptidyl-prolyl cis-trans isomerase [Prevotella sp.]|nr:FKBP-type peptidyl-prolyl cis-trans isomerase [Prevotella sp.]
MKKVLTLALLVLAGASFSTVTAKDKKKDKKKTETVEQKLELKTASDSLSYAAGMAMTRGLDGYLEQRMGVTKAQMPDFLRGLKQGIASRNDSTFAAYVAGLTICEQVQKTMLPNVTSQFEGTSEPINAEMLYAGFLAALQKDTTFFKQEGADRFFEGKQLALKAQKEAATKAEGEKFLAENKTKPGVVTLPDGLQYKVLTKGTGEIPTVNDKVTVVYEGRTLDGKVFDATSKHGTKNDTFSVGGLIKGWTEALTMMPVGSKWEVYIPQELAYGERGAGRDIAPYSALIFTLELQGIQKSEPKTEKPAEDVAPVAKAPAKRTAKKAARK